MPCLGVPTWRVVVLTIALAALSAAKVQASDPSPQGPPDDRYVKVLADCKLHGGKGFPGVLELGAPAPEFDKDGLGKDSLGEDRPQPPSVDG